jgi:hydroxymethylpyrimidine kinase/phosphomethylpyrimidine kinase/thiamine-phosphate diphosphorylase
MGYLLTIAGHDPVHGAGITADLATWAAMGLEGASVVTALTVQNSSGLDRVEPVAPALVRDALQAVLRDGEPLAIKLGLLGSTAIVDEVRQFVAARRCPVVLDPVLAASNGRAAHDADRSAFLAALRALMRHADVITPNLPEALALLDDVPVRLEGLSALCRGGVVLKGGHAVGADSPDWVSDGRATALLSAPRLPLSAHGTGCVFSAALAGMLADGWGLFDAAAEAKLRVLSGIAQARAVGPGRPHVHAAAPADSRHLPTLRWVPPGHATRGPAAASAFAPMAARIGFYPVVPDADWVERLLGWGVRTVQLRIKAGTLDPDALQRQVERAVAAGRAAPDAQVFINDHWAMALAAGAYGVHLGQEDLETADLPALQRAGLRLGISSHTPAEMARAHAVQPSYVAIGPVFPTTLKQMPYRPVGLERLRRWTQRYQPRYPVVAIGGIDLARARAVAACGVDGVAVVSAVTQAADAQAASRAFLECLSAGDRS